MPLGMEIDLRPGNIVLHGDPAPPPKKKRGHSMPNIAPCIVAKWAWIKMPVGVEVSLGPGHIVLDEDPQMGTAVSGQCSAHRAPSPFWYLM